MTAQDRFFIDRAAARAAPLPPRKTSDRPVANGHPLILAHCVALGSSLAGTASVFVGTLPSDPSNIKGYVLSTCAASALGLGSLCAWHITHKIACHATDLPRLVMAGLGSVFLVGMGCLTSGSFLAANIGGDLAIKVEQHQAVDLLKKTENLVTKNAAADMPLSTAIDNLGDAFGSAAPGEDRSSAVAKTKPGKGGAYDSINNAAVNTRKVASQTREQTAKRDDLLRQAHDAINETDRDIATGDAAGFEVAFAKSTKALTAVEQIKLSASAQTLGLGWIVDKTAAPWLSAQLSQVDKMRQQAAENREAVVVPTFTAIDARSAVVAHPPFLAWVCSLLIETLPGLMTALLIGCWREEKAEEESWLPPFVATRTQSAPQPLREAAE